MDRTRLHRSDLCVTGTSVKMLEKHHAPSPNVVMLDLEDAVAPDDRAQARHKSSTGWTPRCRPRTDGDSAGDVHVVATRC